MTDTGNEERPLTRRELRARERAAAEAAREQAVDQPEEAEASPRTESAAPVEEAAQEAEVAQEVVPEEPAAEEPVVEVPVAEEPVDEEPDFNDPAPTQAMSIEHLAAERETQPLAPEDLPTPASETPEQERTSAPEVPEPVQEPAVEDSAPKKGVGRFFGRRKLDNAAETETPEDFDELLGVEPASEAAEEDEAVGIEDLATELEDDTQHEQHSTEEVAPVAAEHVADEPTGVFAADSPEVDAPARARGLRLDEGRRQNLDSVSDEDVDSIEIDEVEVTEARISAQSVSEKTPAQLEDTRGASFEQDEEQPSGPTRGRGSRLPFVVNVVEDTSEHHISDLRRGSEGLQGQNVSGSSGNITANALVLPASGQEDEIQFESEDGVLVTGSIDLPDGYAASGRARGKFDSPDIDSSSDSSEVSNPETAPVRASRAVSSYASARVNIAPKRQSRSALPWALGIGGGVVFAGIVVVVVGYTAGWF